MQLDPIKQKQIMDLLILSLDGEAGIEEMQKLKDILESSTQARDYYLKAIMTAESIREMEWAAKDFEYETDKSESFNAALWTALANDEKTAPVVQIAKADVQSERQEDTALMRPARKISKFPIITAIVACAALLMVFLYVCLNPQMSEVATLTDSVNPQWVNPACSAQIGSRLLTTTKPVTLNQGIIKILYDNDVEVLIEAPAEYQILSSKEMALQSGRLFATVSPAGRGFAVKTKNTRIVDLGTKFGVYSDPQNKTELHVFKGKTTLTVMADKTAKNLGVIGGQAREVDAAGSIKDIQLNKGGFVRAVDSKTNLAWRGQNISLADIVGGGNGFDTGQLNQWLDVITGQPGEWIHSGVNPVYPIYRYHPVKHLQGVDGVFIPDGEKGPVQVSTSGDMWTECPDTSGEYFENIYNGHKINEGIPHTLTVHGQAYGTHEHPGLALHSNTGITFDLNKIRDRLSGGVFTGFRSGCAISSDAEINSKVDIWVLVDGKVRTSLTGLSRDEGLRDIAVKLKSADRFLSLVCTDNNRDPGGDWAFFAEPQLDIEFE